MSAPPYMPFFVADYLADTTHLSQAEHGAYLLLLMAMWRAGGELPADDAYLIRVTRSRPGGWAKIKPTILAFFEIENGKLLHRRLANELQRYTATQLQRSSAGKASATAKALKTQEVGSTGVGVPLEQTTQQKSTILEPEPEPEREVANTPPPSAAAVVAPIGGAGSDDWPNGDLVKALVEATESPKLDPSKSPGLITTAGRLAAWRREGASWTHDVLPVVRGLCAGHRGPVTTWKFFDAAIGRSIADNRQALAIPAAETAHRSAPQSIGDRIAAEHAEARNRAFRMLENGNSR